MIKLNKIKKFIHSFLYPIVIGSLVFLATKVGFGLLMLAIVVFASLIADFNDLYE